MFETNTATSMATPTSPVWRMVNPSTAVSGTPSSNAPRTIDRPARGPHHLPLAVPAAPLEAADQDVPEGECGGAGEEPECGSGMPSHVDGLFHELEGDGADEHTGAEPHHQAEEPLARWAQRRHRRTEEQRPGGHGAPEECLGHDDDRGLLPQGRWQLTR